MAFDSSFQFFVGTAAAQPLTGVVYRSTVLTDTPTILYELEDDGVGQLLEDLSGNTLTGAYTASDVTYEQTGPLTTETSTAATFGGVSGMASYTSLTSGNRPAYPFCLEAWVKPNSASASDVVVLIADSLGQELAKIAVGSLGLVWQMGIDNLGGGTNTNALTTALVDGAWQHVLCRFVSATERYLYQNALLIAGGTGQTSQTWTGTNTTSYGLYIAGNDQGASLLPGSLSRVGFYNHDVSPQRISEHFNAGVPYYGIDGTLSYGPAIDGDMSYGPAICGDLSYGPAIDGTLTYGPPA